VCAKRTQGDTYETLQPKATTLYTIYFIQFKVRVPEGHPHRFQKRSKLLPGLGKLIDRKGNNVLLLFPFTARVIYWKKIFELKWNSCGHQVMDNFEKAKTYSPIE